ncbi:ubiquitin-like protein [Cryptosporidium canis]|nr:ubiquitin-like protein [Cryptosporidium canis]
MVSNEEIESFISVSGCTDTVVARRYLEMYPGDMNSAINEYFSNLGNESSGFGDSGANLFHGDDNVRTPIPSFNDQLLPDDHGILGSSDHYIHATRAVVTENGITSVSDFSKVFSAPDDILFNDSFEIAKEQAKAQKKFILVNIQSPQEFSSVILNRDIWCDSLMMEFIQEHFIFWQRECATPDGNEWMNRYNITKLPHVSVVDPRTGRQLKSWDVAKSFSDSVTASSEMIEFLESESTIKALERLRGTSSSTSADSSSSAASNTAELSSSSISSFLAGGVSGLVQSQSQTQTQAQAQAQPDTMINVPKINSELAQLHMERMRRKNSEKQQQQR